MKPLSTFLRAAGAVLLHAAGTFAFRLLVAFFGGLLLVAVARPCGYVRSYAPTYHAPVYETPVLAAVYTPTVLAVAVPQVTVGYAAPAIPTPAPVAAALQTPPSGSVASPCEQQLAAIRQEVAELRALLKQPAPPPAGAGDSLPSASAPGLGGAPAHSVMLSCVQCHGRTAAQDGKGFRYFDDGGKLLATAPVGKMIREVYSGRMPKKDAVKHTAAFDDQQVAQFIDEIGGGAAPATPNAKEGAK